MDLQQYKQLLYSNNTSVSYLRLLQEKIGGEEIILTTTCQFTKTPVDIPIRHSSMCYIHCLFDLENWMEHYKNESTKIQTQTIFICPGCKSKNTYFKDYGIDFHFYHVLQEMKLFKSQNKHLKINYSQLIYSPSKNMYYVEEKLNNNNNNNNNNILNSKIKVIPKRYPLPGCVPVLGVSRRLKELNLNQNLKINDNQQRILDELSLTIVKLQQLLFSKLYQVFKKKTKDYPFKLLQDKVATKKDLCKKQLNSALKLIQLGKKSLKDDYVFALKKFSTNNQLYSILIVYFVQYGIWYEYQLTLNGQPYVQLEQALYIKGDRDDKTNTIYIIGGQKQDRFSQSNQCLQLTFPRDPFQQVDEKVKITALPNYPLEGYHFMGTCYKGNLFVFYGQKQITNSDNQIKCQLLNSQYVLRKNNRWEQLRTNLFSRYDGSFFTLEHQQLDKLIIFLGGVQNDPDGQPNHKCAQQQQGQIFLCRDEKFLGDVNQGFNITFSEDYHRSLLAAPIFSCPYYGNNQLILSGDCLKKRNVEQREIYTFDWANAVLKLNELFSLEPPEYIFTPYRRRTTNYDIFSPVQDPQGAIAYGNFYVIHQYEVEQNTNSNEQQQKVMTQLLKINLTNGLFFQIPYEYSQISREIALSNFQRLENKENQNL